MTLIHPHSNMQKRKQILIVLEVKSLENGLEAIKLTLYGMVDKQPVTSFDRVSYAKSNEAKTSHRLQGQGRQEKSLK